MSQQKKLETWIRKQLLRSAPSKLVLRHAKGVGGTGAIVGSIEITDAAKAEPEALAIAVLELAEQDADAFRGAQVYALTAYEAEEPEPLGRTTFRMATDTIDDNTIEATEAPTRDGQVSQQMRHNEALMRINQAQMGECFRSMQSMLQIQGRIIEGYQQREEQTLALRRRLQEEEAETNMRMLSHANGEENKQKAVELLLQMAPMAVPLLLQALTPAAAEKKE